MLKHLLIRNYALIKSLDLDFSEGLTTVTGETGAGKSILLGAIGLILGQRADSSEISTGETERDGNREDRKSTRLNSSHLKLSRMPSSA